MPLTELEKRTALSRNEMLEQMHHHEFKGVALACGECGLSAADPLHSWTPPGPVLSIDETEGQRLLTRNTQNKDIYKHPFALCESTGNCKHCQLPSGDEMHDAVSGTANISRS